MEMVEILDSFPLPLRGVSENMTVILMIVFKFSFYVIGIASEKQQQL